MVEIDRLLQDSKQALLQAILLLLLLLPLLLFVAATKKYLHSATDSFRPGR